MHPRAEIVDFLFRNLPTIDNFNKLRQYSLQVEDQWPTCWVKLLNGYLGQSIVNQQKLLSYKYPDIPGKDLTPKDMAASISAGLRRRQRVVQPVALRLPLKRVSEEAKKAAGKEKANGKRTRGSSKQRTCFICKKYQEKYCYSTGACPKCGTCICLKTTHEGRDMTCCQEHLSSADPAIRCNGKIKVQFPKASRASNWKPLAESI